jgi:hypothetical protein
MMRGKIRLSETMQGTEKTTYAYIISPFSVLFSMLASQVKPWQQDEAVLFVISNLV